MMLQGAKMFRGHYFYHPEETVMGCTVEDDKGKVSVV